MTDRESSEAERFRRVEAIFHAAIALAEDARPRFVREQAAGDEALTKRLLGMLQADDRSDTTTSLLERARRDAVPAGALVGARLGRYRLVEFLGDGSFGEVYAGEQLEPIRRRVAIKVLYAAVSAEGSVERFQDEAQALAAMSHAGIARIYDAGHDSPAPGPSGRGLTDPAAGIDAAPPRLYLVMEHVEGASITAFAARERLDIAARIGLIASVADAVQHAHQKGIIHRDLKPSNVLVNSVDGVPTPKVIDFGVAKVIEGPHVHTGLGEEARPLPHGGPTLTARAVRRELSGTPQYMSPEQGDLARSADVDTRSDIYSLGVILYELVTGLVPFEAGRTEERRILPPSARQPSERGGAAAMPPIPRAMRVDLDHIVMKALEADPERRYASAAAFADDLRRLLRGDAVLAAPQTVGYRLRAALRRHRVATTIAAILLVAATIASIGIITGMVRARTEAARGDAINGFMRDVLTSVNPDRGGAHVELATVLNDASRLAAERFAGRPEVEAETRMLLGSIDVNLGRYPEALIEFRAAERLRTEAFGAESIPALESTIAATQVELARLRVSEVAPGLPELLRRVQAACGPRHRNAARVEAMIARAELQQGRAIEAEVMFRSTAEWVRASLPNDAELLAELLRDRLRVLRRIALLAAASREPSVVTMREVYDLAVERLAAQREAGGPAALETLRAELDLAKVAMDCGAKTEGLARADAILASTERTLGACHSVRADTRAVRRSCLRALGRADEAADEAKRCIECVRASTSENSIELFAVRMDVLSMLDYAGRIAECESDARALAADLAALGAKFQPMKMAAEIHLARALSRQGHFDEAEAIFDRLVEAEEEFSWNSDRARLHAYRAGHLAARGRIDEARQAMARSLELLPGEGRSILSQEPDDRIVILIAIAEAAGDTAEAERYRAMQRSVLSADSSAELRAVRR